MHLPPKFLTVLFCLIGTLTHLHAQNTLTAKEKADGWQLLFNGRNTQGWHTYNGKGVGAAWQIQDNALHLSVPNRAGNKAVNGGDLVTDVAFTGDFEFKADWKVDRLTNSGIFFFVQESPTHKNVYDTGLELQVLDNAIYGEADENKHRAGDFFGVANARVREVNPVGSWNQVYVKKQKNQLIVTLNGFTVHEFDLSSADWKSRLSGSKLKDAPIGKGVFAGRIGLQDWGSPVWFRNIKIRRL
ncbi:DUF1080 domain-containing protein [Rudanella paleaurantiibacter]|uniref:DUF1080 domain-containing protein n=1 Tax=Rudanella paleaurantiibacter TaxID=2614655 RepID=A0A7J5TU83_9BACT|nr:DUF1080 domain-containing protein [Rudanella paleaurantiibacter]KAB7727565.1 DUF1080 domain-containing protein [Rudanella paleaurantiibacter]